MMAFPVTEGHDEKIHWLTPLRSITRALVWGEVGGRQIMAQGGRLSCLTCILRWAKHARLDLHSIKESWGGGAVG